MNILKELNELEVLMKSTGLMKSSPKDMLDQIKSHSGRFAILTADRPRFRESGVMTREDMHAHLKGMQEQGKIGGFFNVTGKYRGDPDEYSFLVHDPSSFSDITSLGQRAGQESVFLSHNGTHQVAFVNGEHAGNAYQGQGHKLYDKDPDTDSSVPEGDKPYAYSQLPTQGHKTYTFMESGFTDPQSNPPKQPIMKSSGGMIHFNPNIDYSKMVPHFGKKEKLSGLIKKAKKPLHLTD